MRKIVTKIEEEELEADSQTDYEFATGGILTKLKAADYLMKRKIDMFVASGFDLDDIRNYMFKNDHKGGTLFTCKDK